MRSAPQEVRVLGMMSGSSLDGMDFAICRFVFDKFAERPVSDWSILAATTEAYPEKLCERLRTAPDLSGRELWRLHADLGRWAGRRAAAFLLAHPEHPVTLAGSHGHTIFHEPQNGFTTQIGDGAAMARTMGLPTVTDFRSADVAAGGQGAPLAPVADKYLFKDYGAFLNLGGIANLSVRQSNGDYLAGDISGCCQMLDRLANLAGLPYDDGGQLAASGNFQADLAGQIDALPFHALPYPKSLGNAWVRDQLWPILKTSPHSAPDRLRTFTDWLANKIVADMRQVGAAAGAGKGEKSKVLLTGGGARNTYLINQLNTHGGNQGLSFVVPDKTTADFKEAALIALCTLLCVHELPNSFAASTGASHDTINGAVYLPNVNNRSIT